jgi:hypothetical protein
LLNFIGYIYVVVALISICRENSVKITISMHMCKNEMKIICTYVGEVVSIFLFWRHSLYPFIEFI